VTNDGLYGAPAVKNEKYKGKSSFISNKRVGISTLGRGVFSRLLATRGTCTARKPVSIHLHGTK
jgi:hypothetical protein